MYHQVFVCSGMFLDRLQGSSFCDPLMRCPRFIYFRKLTNNVRKICVRGLAVIEGPLLFSGTICLLNKRPKERQTSATCRPPTPTLFQAFKIQSQTAISRQRRYKLACRQINWGAHAFVENLQLETH